LTPNQKNKRINIDKEGRNQKLAEYLTERDIEEIMNKIINKFLREINKIYENNKTESGDKKEIKNKEKEIKGNIEKKINEVIIEMKREGIVKDKIARRK
jgi:hypothetical protein